MFSMGKRQKQWVGPKGVPKPPGKGPSWAPPTAAPEDCPLAGAEAAVPVTVPSCDWFIVGGLGLL